MRVLVRDWVWERDEETVLVAEVDGAGGGGLVDPVAECEAERVPAFEGERVVDAVCDGERVDDGAIGSNRQNRCAVPWKFLRRSCSVMPSNNTIPPSPAAFSTPAENFREFWTSRDDA